jgi:hypothetical protein
MRLTTLALAGALALSTSAQAEVVSHPKGCPWRLFCGCGVSVRVFGHPIKALFRAAAWRRFQRTTAHAGAVAWRWHHVMHIIRMTGSHTAITYDPNSGGHLTRIHEVDLRGYRFVDPTATALSARTK